MKNVYEMTREDFDKWLKTATPKEVIEAFCMGKTHAQIERDITNAERMDSHE